MECLVPRFVHNLILKCRAQFMFHQEIHSISTKIFILIRHEIYGNIIFSHALSFWYLKIHPQNRITFISDETARIWTVINFQNVFIPQNFHTNIDFVHQCKYLYLISNSALCLSLSVLCSILNRGSGELVVP